MSDSLYTIRDMEFSYDGMTPVLTVDHLELDKGKIHSFRGHNGSGKTTLLKLLCGIIKADRGEILSEGEKAILVHQEPYLFQGTVYQNLLYPLRFNSLAGRDRNERIAEALDMVGLSGFEKRKARELSGGEKKRVAIARALMTGPSVLFLDEPDANIDSKTSLELETLMICLRDKGISLVICTHNSAMAYRVSDRIIDLYKGRPVEHYENIFKGSYSFHEGMHSQLQCGEFALSCPSRHGAYTTAVVSSKDVYLSKDSLEKEDYNQLTGTLEAIVPFKEDRYILTVDCGIKIHSQISSTALEILQAEIGDRIHALFAPPAVHLY